MLNLNIQMLMILVIVLSLISITHSFYKFSLPRVQCRSPMFCRHYATKFDDLLQKTFQSTNIASLSLPINLVSGKDIWNRVKSVFQRQKDEVSDGDANSKTTSEPIEKEIVIIGAGIAGLACLKSLLNDPTRDCSSILLLEQADRVGGRIFTDEVDGFLLDNGFQVFIDQYPNSLQLFNYSSLQLKKFSPGAIVHRNNAFYAVYDPFRMPQKLLDSLFTPIGTIVDKVIVSCM